VAVINCYFDESGKMNDAPAISFSGVCVKQSALAKFDDEWKELLRHFGLPSLHMKEISDLNIEVCPSIPANRTFKDTINILKQFADCMNDHLEIGIIQAWDVPGFKALDPTVVKGMGSPTNPYYLAFARGVMELSDYAGADDQISIICDEDAETAWKCFQHYLGLREADPDIRKKTISLSFADDEHFPALQAADLTAYLSRREAWRLFYKRPYCFEPLFDYLTKERGAGKMIWRALFADNAMQKSIKPSK
jgi:hypothetical protein